MPSILVAIDGSEQSLRALNKVIDGSALYKAPPEIHLATIHLPVPYAGRVSHAKERHCARLEPAG